PNRSRDPGRPPGEAAAPPRSGLPCPRPTRQPCRPSASGRSRRGSGEQRSSAAAYGPAATRSGGAPVASRARMHEDRAIDGKGEAMASNRRSENLAARVGRWSARHWKTAVFGWLAFVIAVFVLGRAVGTKQLSSTEPGPGESGRVQRILNSEFK